MTDANQNGVPQENGVTDTEQIPRDQTTHDYLTGLKEREELKSQLHEREKEVYTLRGQIYDMMKKMEALERQVGETSKEGAKKRKQSKVAKPKKIVRRKKPGEKANELKPSDAAKDSGDPFEDTETLYKEIAQKFPDIPLKTVLDAEERFVQADINGDGTIDSDELEKLLDGISRSVAGLFFTKDKIKEIMKQIDLDNTNSIDFIECVGLLDLLRQKKKTGLTMSEQSAAKSQVCTIQ